MKHTGRSYLSVAAGGGLLWRLVQRVPSRGFIGCVQVPLRRFSFQPKDSPILSELPIVRESTIHSFMMGVRLYCNIVLFML